MGEYGYLLSSFLQLKKFVIMDSLIKGLNLTTDAEFLSPTK